MKKLHVIYEGWGERWPVGTLADASNNILFEYSQDAISRGLQLSPMHHPLPRAGAAVVAFQAVKSNASFQGLPGFIADALPDGWGMLLMDRALRQLGRDPNAVSVLERLAIVGNRAMGSLSFEPADEDLLPVEKLQLKDLAKAVAALQTEESANSQTSPQGTHDQLRHLMQLGGSPQGARPKVLVDYNTRTGAVTSGMDLTGSATPWLVKFPANHEHREVSALEALYARIARHGGLDIPRSCFFDLGAKHSAFGVERFDRSVVKDKQGNMTLLRIPIMSLSAMLQADHRMPSLDYETVLLATLRITGSQAELLKAFERCVLNVLLHNRDDHSRNFAFRLDAQDYWKLAPVFDLTFSSGPGGEHSTSVLGHGKGITRTHLLQLAKRCGVGQDAAQTVIEQHLKAARALPKLAKDLPIRVDSLKRLTQTVTQQATLLH